MIPRDDSDPDAVSGLLIFTPIAQPEETEAADADPHDPGPHVIIVPYLVEVEDGQSLLEWTEMYESLGDTTHITPIQRQSRRVIRIREAQAVREEGVSSLTTYQFTNVAHQNMVWDIWTNIPSIDPYGLVYDRMVRSFRFESNSPKSLSEAYGSDFVPIDMEEMLRINSGDRATGLQDLAHNDQHGPDIGINDLTNTWYSPVLNTSSGARRTVRCGSDAHSGSSYYAADISVPDHTSVWNAKVGTVTFAGPINNGYGNLVKVKAQGGKEAYYAHLESISSGTTSHLNQQIGTGFWMGWSGHSTCATCRPLSAHLHFHVQWNGNAENLVGMVGFYPDSDSTPWPGAPGSGTGTDCAQMGR